MTKDDILEAIIIYTIENLEIEGVVNIGLLARKFKESTNNIRPYLKELEKEGYIEKRIRKGGWCQYTYEPYPPVKGYSLTDKTLKSSKYRKIKEDENERLEKINKGDWGL